MNEREREFLSIGDVLDRLRPEFPDASISKIRFLESQGLIEPERTPSGYRKFYDHDVERLRYILRRQRESYLPLRVIRDELEAGASPAPPTPSPSPSPAPPPAPSSAPVPASAIAAVPASATESSGTSVGHGVGPEVPPAAHRAVDLLAGPAKDPFAVAETGVSLSLEELSQASGLSVDDIGQLESFGLLAGQRAFSAVYYDEDALVVAKAAAGFRRYGVEPRHLRMYKTAAEREGAFFETLVIPMLRKRSADSRRQAADALADLARLGEHVRHVTMRRVLRAAAGNDTPPRASGRAIR